MHLFRKKFLGLSSGNWFVGDALLYVTRVPRTDFLYVTQAYPFKPPSRFVLIPEFIMAHHTNALREEVSYFIFKKLEWEDNICIRRAILENKIHNYQDEVNPRIVNGEVWTQADYDLDFLVRPNPSMLPFDEYPELPFGITTLPPYAPLDRVKITRLLPANPETASPNIPLLEQLSGC